MSLKIALHCNAMEEMKHHQYTTPLLGIEAQDRGHALYHYTPEDLFLEDGVVKAHARHLTLSHDPACYYTYGDDIELNLAKDIDIVLLRHDPPFDEDYMVTTYLLEKISNDVLVTNNPTAIRNIHGKIFTSEFDDFIVPYAIGNSFSVLEKFYNEHNDIILKPLGGYGGYGIIRIKPNAQRLDHTYDMYKKACSGFFMAQKFIPDADKGDKRITLMDGDPVAAILRVPSEPGALANITAGASVQKTEITDRERALCDKLGPILKDRGLFLVGIDFLGDYLTEINVISPGTLRDTNKLYGIKLEEIFWEKLEAKF